MSSAADQQMAAGETGDTPWWESDEDLPMLAAPQPQAVQPHSEAPPGTTHPAAEAAVDPSAQPYGEPERENRARGLANTDSAADTEGAAEPTISTAEAPKPASGESGAGPHTDAAQAARTQILHVDPDRTATDTGVPAAHTPTTRVQTPTMAAPGLKQRGIFVIQASLAALGCVVGFLISGTTSIPALAGWGLLFGSVLSALLSPPRLGWTAVWMPPLAMAAVIAVLGQFTLLGAMPSFAREVGMIAAGLTAVAPAQLLSVGAAAGILWLKRRGGAVGAVSATGSKQPA